MAPRLSICLLLNHLASRVNRPSRLLGICIFLAACASSPPAPQTAPSAPSSALPPGGTYFRINAGAERHDLVLYALGLLNTRYTFGGRNPEAGLDCSGMVSYIVEKVSGQKLPHNAAQIAAITRPVARHQLAPGDLVFFNTNGQRFSHMGIYLDDRQGGRFVHAPSSRGQVRIELLNSIYFTQRFTEARTLFE